jgi:hypothetical protein
MTEPRGPAAGIDPAQAWSILRATLRMRMRVGGGTRLGRAGKPRGLLLLAGLYALMGTFVGMLAFIHVDIFTFGALLFAMTFFLGGTMVISESSQVLFNRAEADILGHRPIHPRTLLLAKSLGLFFLSAFLAIALNLAPAFMGMGLTDRPWLFPLVHLTMTLLTALFASGAVVFVYALLTRVVGRERFDGFAAWTQVAATVVMIVGYQIVPRLIDRVHGFHIDHERLWFLALPPAWFAALEAIATGQPVTPMLAAMAGLALLGTFALAWGAVIKLAGTYAQTLAALGESPVAAPSREPTLAAGRAADRPRAMNRLLRVWLRDPVERGSYLLAGAYMRRDRDVRMRLYPSLATIAVFAVLPLIDPGSGGRAGPALVLTFIGMLTTTAMATLKMSSQHAAGDVFRYAPLAGTASVFHGVRKAVIMGFVLPAFLLVSPILWFTIHQHRLLLVMLPVLAAMPTLSLLNGLAGDYLPLSTPPTLARQGATNIVYMIAGALSAALISTVGLLGLRFGWFWPFFGLELVFVAGLHALLLRGIRVRPLAPLE